MKLSKLYTNHDNIFEPIIFNEGLNIILGEIRLKENQNRDTHNLGKTTLGVVIDFCLLKGHHKDIFLFKHKNLFEDFTFFLEVKTQANTYLTIRRSVKNHTKIAIHKHSQKHLNLNNLSNESWSHNSLHTLDRAKTALDSLLNLSFVKPWSYRQCVSYAIRGQYDFKEVFKLPKFHYDQQWKPYIAHVLGLNFEYVANQYTLKKEYEKIEQKVKEIEKQDLKSIDSIDKLEGLILIKEEEIEKIKLTLESFNFQVEDKNITHELVSNIDQKIATLNKERYYILQVIEKIQTSLSRQEIIFNVDETEKLFNEAGILFEGQIKKTYEQLIKFNLEITVERKQLLQKELAIKNNQLKEITNNLELVNNSRAEALVYLENKKTFEKYKILSNKLVDKQTSLYVLKHQAEVISEYNNLKLAMIDAKERLEKNERLLAENVKNNKKDSTYSSVRLHFNQIIKDILDKEAIISIKMNKEGNLEFQESIIDPDGISTSESDGKTYKKLLCLAFDICINQVHLDKKFSHFTFHDGFLETLETRKKIKFIDMLRKLTQYEYQYIGTVIDSDLPNHDKSIFSKSEIILTLHDDKNGTLFKGITW